MVKIASLLLVAGFVFLACKQKQQEASDMTVPDPVALQVNEYPDIILRSENGEQISAKQLTGNNVFILFQPDCDHCQEEAVQIEQRLEEFKDYTLYFISSAPMESIVAFSKSFGLNSKENVKFAWTATEGVLTYYGPIQTPSVYVYSDGHLKGSFNGQTEIDNILNML